MNAHLTDQAILDHQFQLDSPRRARKAESHLAECADCRARAAQLHQNLSRLDALKTPTEAPERLIADTLRTILQKTPSEERLFRPTWVWIAGPVAIAALLLIMIYPRPSSTPVASRPIEVAMVEKEEAAPATISQELKEPATPPPVEKDELQMPAPAAPAVAEPIPAKEADVAMLATSKPVQAPLVMKGLYAGRAGGGRASKLVLNESVAASGFIAGAPALEPITLLWTDMLREATNQTFAFETDQVRVDGKQVRTAGNEAEWGLNIENRDGAPIFIQIQDRPGGTLIVGIQLEPKETRPITIRTKK